MDKKILRVVCIALFLCTITPLASADTFVLEEDQKIPMSLYTALAAVVILAAYYSFTFNDRNSFTDTFCAFLCALLSLFLMIFTFWGIQDDTNVWRSGWLGGIWGLVMVYFIGIVISKIIDITTREGVKI